MAISLPVVSSFDPKGLRQAREGLESFGAKSGQVAGAVGKAFGVMAVAAGAAAAGLLVASVKAFGELEQNLGGSEAVFGEFAKTVQDSGAAAFKNLGISQSEYLETANKMGALFQGSGISQVDSLNMTQDAMQRAADMASVMGIDMSVAMDSVAGAAKGNFTMMDNLGVAMNATSIEAFAASKGITDFSFATASAADKADMAMQMFMENTSQYAGNFAKEATETITGSLGMLKAASSSLLAGLGDANADVALLADNVVTSFEAVVKNVVPIVENIADALPQALGAMVDAVGPLIGSIGGVIIGLVPTIIDAAVELADALLRGVAETLPELMTMMPKVITSMVDAIFELLPVLIEAGVDTILALAKGIVQALPELIPQLVNGLLATVDALIEALPLLMDAGLEIVTALMEGILDSIPVLIAALPELIRSIIGFIDSSIPMLIESGLNLFLAIVEALPEIITGIVGAIPQIIGGLLSAILGSLPQLILAGLELFIALVAALPEIITAIVAAIPEIITAVVGAIIESVPELIAAGSELIKGIWQGINDMAGWLRGKISGFFGGVVDDIKNFFGIKSPSTVFAEMGKNLGQGMAAGIVGSTKDVEKAMDAMMVAGSATLPPMDAMMAAPSMGAVMAVPSMSAVGVPFAGKGRGAGGGRSAVGGGKNVYNITVNAGMGSSGAQLGEQIVSAIKTYERSSGRVFVGV